jgi:hypothetical protein
MYGCSTSWRKRRPGVAQERLEVGLDELARAEDRAAEAAPLPVDVLGRRVDDDVGPELQRSLQERRGEHVVDHHLGTGAVGEVADRRDVDELHRRVAG